MYEAFFGLREKPFSLMPDPGFLFLSGRHQEALTLLEYGLANQAGFIVLTGDIGVGKTTLMRYLLARLEGSFSVGLISQTHASLGNLMDWVCSAFDLKAESDTQLSHQRSFVDFVIAEYAKGKRTLLIVDEAQNLTTEHLEQLRLLSNINADKDLVLQLMLIGQPQLRDRLREPGLEQFVQRIAASYHLQALAAAETVEYIQHRVSVAGAEQAIFSVAACEAVYEYTQGVPRLINLICDLALVYAYAAGSRVVRAETVEEVVEAQAGHLLVTLDRAQRPARTGNDTGDGSELRLGSLHHHEMAGGPVSVSRSMGARSARDVDERSAVSDDAGGDGPQQKPRVSDKHGTDPGQAASEAEPGRASEDTYAGGSAGGLSVGSAAGLASGVGEAAAAASPGPLSQDAGGMDMGSESRHSAKRSGFVVQARDFGPQAADATPAVSGERSRTGRVIGVTSVVLILSIFALGAGWWVLSGRESGVALDTASSQGAGGPPSAAPSIGGVSSEAGRQMDVAQAIAGDEKGDPETGQPAIDLERQASAGDRALQSSEASAVRAEDASAASEERHGDSEVPTESDAVASVADSVSSKPAFVAVVPHADVSVEADDAVQSPATSSADDRSGRPTGPDAAALAADLSGLGIDARVEDSNRLILDLADKVQFAAGSVDLNTRAEAFLSALAAQLVKASPRQLLVIGHTDRQGGAAVNAVLSERRAEAVMRVLSESGLSGIDLRSEGRGETEPKVSMAEERIVGAAANRRIELELLLPGEPSGSDD